MISIYSKLFCRNRKLEIFLIEIDFVENLLFYFRLICSCIIFKFFLKSEKYLSLCFCWAMITFLTSLCKNLRIVGSKVD